MFRLGAKIFFSHWFKLAVALIFCLSYYMLLIRSIYDKENRILSTFSNLSLITSPSNPNNSEDITSQENIKKDSNNQQHIRNLLMYDACKLEFNDSAIDPCYILQKFGTFRITRNYIYFLKTHKTAGSTFQSMVFRIAHKYGIPFIRPGNVTIGKRGVFAYHDYFNKIAINKLFPRDKSFYVSIIRKPVSQYMSAYNYYQRFPQNMNEINYLNSLKDFDTDDKDLCTHINSYCHHFSLLKCLETTRVDPKFAVHHVLKNFDLIMLTEYFNEGIIIFKKLFDLSYDDVMSLKLNMKKIIGNNVTEALESLVNETSQCDKALYDYYSRFYRVISPFFKNEVKILKEKQTKLFNFCVERYQEDFASVIYPNIGYKLKTNLSENEISYCKKFTSDIAELYK